MSNDSTRSGKPGTGGRSLWSRIKSALAPLTDLPGAAAPQGAVADPPPDDAAGPDCAASLSDRFASQLFARLLLELPEHRQAFRSAWLAGDRQALAGCTHRLAGAVAYCDLPELGAALGELGSTLRVADEARLQGAYNRVSREIDLLLDMTGQR